MDTTVIDRFFKASNGSIRCHYKSCSGQSLHEYIRAYSRVDLIDVEKVVHDADITTVDRIDKHRVKIHDTTPSNSFLKPWR